MPRHDGHTREKSKAQRRRENEKLEKFKERAEQRARLNGRRKRRNSKQHQRVVTDIFSPRFQNALTARPTEKKEQQWTTNTTAPAPRSAGHTRP